MTSMHDFSVMMQTNLAKQVGIKKKHLIEALITGNVHSKKEKKNGPV